MKTSAANENRGGRRICTALALAVVVVGHATKVAAVEHGRWPHATYYTVVARQGDSVSTIAGRYRVSPSLVAKLNGLNTMGRMSAGRVLLIPAITRVTREAVLSEALDRSAPNYATRPGPLVVAHAPGRFTPPANLAPSGTPHHLAVAAAVDGRQPLEPRFSWPIVGPVISSFGPGTHGTRNEGINIAAERGAPFCAAADGTVSYAGPLRGYGNLILITHRHSYVTAYAHADNIAVALGEEVGKGQVIGTAGTSGGVDRPQLHFEIRRGVTPIDPNLLLAANS
jgi:murein DD-endopeptidase MepM/ murein hydrolase activator NlpD